MKENYKVEKICEDCGSRYTYSIKTKREVKCKVCTDSISLGERIVYALLEFKGVEFIHDNETSWSERTRYDFLLPELSTVIEVHGIQHFKESPRGRSLKEEQENDIKKERLALENGIKNYVVIDSSKSEEEFIIQNILNSKLNSLLNLSLEDFKNLEPTHNKISLIIWSLWNEGKSVIEISRAVKKNRNYVRKRLTTGNRVGKIIYSKEISIQRKGRPLVQLDLSGNPVRKYEKLNSLSFTVDISKLPYSKISIDKSSFHIWVYEDEFLRNRELFQKNLLDIYEKQGICLIDSQRNIIKKYISVSHAIREEQYTHNLYSLIRKRKLIDGNKLWVKIREIPFLKDEDFKPSINKNSKAVMQLDLEGNIIQSFPNAKIAYFSLTGKEGSGGSIKKCCNKERKTHLGYRWEYLKQ